MCSTAAPTWAWPARTCCIEHGGEGLYQPLDLQHRPVPHERGGARRLRLRRAPCKPGLAHARGHQVHAHRAPALRRQGRARRPDQALRLDGAGAADRAWPTPSSTWCPPAARSRPTTWSRWSASWTSRARLVVNQAALKLKREPMRALIDAFAAAVADAPMTREASASCATAAADFEAEFQRLLHWSAETDAAIEQRVAEILADVRARGDAAVLEYTARFDGVQAASRGRAGDSAATSCSAAFERHHARAARRAAGGRRARAQLPRAPARGLRPQLELPRRRRHAAGPEGHAAGPRGHLRARRQGGLPVAAC